MDAQVPAPERGQARDVLVLDLGLVGRRRERSREPVLFVDVAAAATARAFRQRIGS